MKVVGTPNTIENPKISPGHRISHIGLTETFIGTQPLRALTGGAGRHGLPECRATRATRLGLEAAAAADAG
jgi:hypothetical protein